MILLRSIHRQNLLFWGLLYYIGTEGMLQNLPILLLFLTNITNSRDPRPVVDSSGRIFAVLAGMPADPTYEASAQAAFKETKAAVRKRSSRRRSILLTGAYFLPCHLGYHMEMDKKHLLG